MSGDDVRAIPHDLPCENCSYNLRGLTASDRCPECGVAVAVALAEFRRRLEIREERMNFLRTADPAWLAKLIEGSVWSILGLIIKSVAVLLPNSIYIWKSPARVIPLSMLATAWVLEWFACWKLGGSDPRDDQRAEQYVRAWLVRVLASAYFVIPIFVEAMRDPSPSIVVTVTIVAIFGGLVVSWLVYWKLRRVAESFSAYLGVLTIIMSCLAPLWFILGLLPELDAPEDTLSQMIHSPSILSGSANVLMTFRDGPYPRNNWIAWIGLLLPALVLVFEIHLFYKLNRFRKRRAVLVVAE